MKNILVQFLEDCAPKDDSGKNYKKGQKIELREDAARHWITRRKAVAVGGEIAAPPAPPAPDSSLTDKAEEAATQKRGRRPAAVSTTGAQSGGENKDFATGDKV